MLTPAGSWAQAGASIVTLPVDERDRTERTVIAPGLDAVRTNDEADPKERSSPAPP